MANDDAPLARTSEGAPVLRFRELSARGDSPHVFRRRVRSLSRVAPGAYADVRGLTVEATHVLAARELAARLTGVAISHVSAAVLWDLPVLFEHLDTVHLTPTADRRGRPRSHTGYRMHPGPAPEHSLTSRRGLLVTTPAATVTDCARLLGTDWGVAVADAALAARLLDLGELEAEVVQARGRRGAAAARAVPALVSARAESPGESLLRVRLRRMHLHPADQVVLVDVEGEPRVDLLVGRWLVVEFDGRGKYRLQGDPAAAVWAEKRRQDRIAEAGYEVVRVAWADLADEVELQRRIRMAVQRAERRHGRPA